MPKLFEELRRRLLVAGVAPRHIRRYIAELQDHLADLRRDAPSEDAAAARLGDLETLARPMLDRPEFRSWTARAPWLTLVGGPILAMAVASAAWFAVFAAIMLSIKAMNPGRTVEPMWLQNMTQGAIYVLIFVTPNLIGWTLSAEAIRRRVTPFWPLIGLAVFALISGAYDVSVTFPKMEGEHGELQIGFGWALPFPDSFKFGLRGAINFVLTAGPYLFWLSRRDREHLA